jgi:hypothetical protein
MFLSGECMPHEKVNSTILHAQAGLPHQDVGADNELEAEKILRVRGVELFLDWTAKVRRKVQDAIQVATVRVGDGIVQLWHALDLLELTTRNIEDAEVRLRRCENRSAGVQKTVPFIQDAEETLLLQDHPNTPVSFLGRFPELDALRRLAATLVVFHHFQLVWNPSDALSISLTPHGSVPFSFR